MFYKMWHKEIMLSFTKFDMTQEDKVSVQGACTFLINLIIQWLTKVMNQWLISDEPVNKQWVTSD